ncbi:MAG: tRNA (guanine(46)-N(7))-methyltransferase TrmB [Pseudomonadota bacterium]|nr:tRNA (guanine(46)-N(7))-methyltransferase TrmB [Pseudomonadota bacterium]
MEDKRFYGRRKGKPIKESRQKLLEELLPKVKIDCPPMGHIDLKKSFGIKPKEVWLEIGFGGGEHVAEIAQKYPQIGILGAEPFINGVASLLAHLNGSHMKEAKTCDLAPDRSDNVRIWADDIRILFPHFPDKSFERIFILYPDPWPKARHAERRFVNKKNIPELARMLTDTGAIYVATDVHAYADWALEQMDLSNLFQQVHPDVSLPPEDWIPTRYEKKGLAAGRQPTYLIFRKKQKNAK